MGQDYLNEVQANLKAAAERMVAERREEARKTRSAKIIVVGLLITVTILIALFGDNIANWC